MTTYVVLPAFNEAGHLVPLICDLAEVFREERQEYFLIAVNDGSQDGTGEILDRLAEKLPMRIIHFDNNRGLATALSAGLGAAAEMAREEDVVVTMDADHSHPAGLIASMLRLVREGNDVVIASRYREGSRVVGLPIHRRALSLGISWIMRVLFPIPGVRDFTSGYRAYRPEVVRRMLRERGPAPAEKRGFSCVLDMLLQLREYGLVFAEVPMVLRYDLKTGTSKMPVLKTVTETFRLIFFRKIQRAGS